MNLSEGSRVTQLLRIVSLLSILVFTVTVLSSCGLGDIDPPAVTGQFIDSPVQGLAYQTATQNGTTDNEGNFKYKRREEITFSLGGVFLGKVTDKKTVTPFDLVPGATDDSDPAVINICRFLQSLDEDGNPSNGINITPETAALLEGQSITSEDLNDSLMQGIINTLNAAGVFSANTPRQLVSATDAHNHFLQFLQTVDNDNDRYKDAVDCNDVDPDINPGAKEICEDGVDQDCNGSDLVCPPSTTTSTTTTSSTTSSTVVAGDTTTTTVPGGTTSTTTSTTSTTVPGDTTTTTTTTSTTTTTLPSSGNWIVTEEFNDIDNDGDMDHHSYFYYDGGVRNNVLYDLGLLVAERWDREAEDWDNNGTIDAIYHINYDSNGRHVTTEEDDGINGSIDQVTSYNYDSNGNLLSIGEDEDNDGEIDAVTYLNYDSNGKIESFGDDWDNDLTIDDISHIIYDTNGNWIRIDIDEGHDETIDHVINIIYDHNGNMIRQEIDVGNDTVIDQIDYYVWSESTTTTSALIGGWIFNPGD